MGHGSRGKDYGAIFIYALTDPRDGRVRYVGKARDPVYRWRQHANGVEGAMGHHRGRWLSLLRGSGLKPGLIVLDAVSVAEWREAEARWIIQLRAKGCALVNGTNGGDGLPEGYLRRGATKASRTRSMLGMMRGMYRKQAEAGDPWSVSYVKASGAIGDALKMLDLSHDGVPTLKSGADPEAFRSVRERARLLWQAHLDRFPQERKPWMSRTAQT